MNKIIIQDGILIDLITIVLLLFLAYILSHVFAVIALWVVCIIRRIKDILNK